VCSYNALTGAVSNGEQVVVKWVPAQSSYTSLLGFVILESPEGKQSAENLCNAVFVRSRWRLEGPHRQQGR